MALFYFHTHDGKRYYPDVVGFELADERAARAAALRAVTEMAWDTPLEEDQHEFSVKVKNANGDLIYEATFKLAGEWKKRLE